MSHNANIHSDIAPTYPSLKNRVFANCTNYMNANRISENSNVIKYLYNIGKAEFIPSITRREQLIQF